MPIRTSPSIAIEAGKTLITALVTFPSKDQGVSVTYMIEASYDGGSTWRDVCGGTIHGAMEPRANMTHPQDFFSVKVSHDGRACRMRAKFDTSKIHLANLEIR